MDVQTTRFANVWFVNYTNRPTSHFHPPQVCKKSLPDLSAALDTIDDVTLTHRRSDWYGISGQSQFRFFSYLKNWHQFVKIKDTMSDRVTLSNGIPQGSVLRPAIFTPYTTPLSAIISSFYINHHLYADDNQMYMSLRPMYCFDLDDRV